LGSNKKDSNSSYGSKGYAMDNKKWVFVARAQNYKTKCLDPIPTGT